MPLLPITPATLPWPPLAVDSTDSPVTPAAHYYRRWLTCRWRACAFRHFACRCNIYCCFAPIPATSRLQTCRRVYCRTNVSTPFLLVSGDSTRHLFIIPFPFSHLSTNTVRSCHLGRSVHVIASTITPAVSTVRLPFGPAPPPAAITYLTLPQ